MRFVNITNRENGMNSKRTVNLEQIASITELEEGYAWMFWSNGQGVCIDEKDYNKVMEIIKEESELRKAING